jgi:spore germination protein YaaH
MSRRFPLCSPVLLALALVTACGSGSGGGSGSAGLGGSDTSGSGAAAPRYIVAGWLPAWTAGGSGDQEIVDQAGDGLDEVNLFGYALQPDGSVSTVSRAHDAARIQLLRARGCEVIPTVYDVHDGAALAAVLADPAAQARAIADMVDILVQGGYDGIDIDFEHAKSTNRDAFSVFVADLGRAVRAAGGLLSVTIPGKRAGSRSWAGYDYAPLGAAADRVKIMTYGYSGPWSSAPGPVAPTDWIERVLDYAVAEIPADKIQLGIPFYGYDWPADGSRPTSVSYPRGMALLGQSGGGLHYEPTRGEAWFAYTDANGMGHTVWFSEERSVAAKAALVRAYQLRGLAIWALGYGGAPLWDSIRSELRRPTAAGAP